MTPIIDRSLTLLDFGGHPQKRNYAGRGAVNPKTDVTAEQINNLAHLAASLNKMTPAATLVCTGNTVLSCLTAWGDKGSYTTTTTPVEAPAFAGGSVAGAGTMTVTFPSTVHDAAGVVRSYAISLIALDSPGLVITATVVGNVITLTLPSGYSTSTSWAMRVW